MYEFLKFYDEQKDNYKFKLNIYQSRFVDYCIRVNYDDEEIVFAQEADIDFAFAKAHVLLKRWLINNKGGY